VDFARALAMTLGLDAAMPLRFEYTKPPTGEWTGLAFYDQIAIASRLCKIHRRMCVDAGDFVVVGNGTMKVRALGYFIAVHR
jgi:hypothetical protein